MSGFDLASIMQDASTGSKTFTALATQTLQNTKAQSELTDIMSSAAIEAQSAAESLKQGELTIKQATQQTNLKVARTLGTDAADSGWLIGQMGQRVIESDKNASRLLEDISAKKSVAFLDNPLGYLWAQATVDDDIGAYNIEVRKGELAKDTAAKLESMSQSSFITQNAIEQSVTDATIKDSKILAGYQYGDAARKAQLEGLRTNLQGMQQAASATAQSIDFKFKGLNAVNDQKRLDMAYEQLAMSRESFNLQKEAKSRAMDEESLTGDFISKGYFAMSGKTLDPVKAKEMLALYKRGQPEIVALFNSGMHSSMIGKSVISTSPYDASNAYATGLAQPANAAQADVAKYLSQKRQEFGSPQVQATLGIDPKDKGGQERAFNTWITAQSKIAGATGQGIYAPAALETVVKTNPNMAALPVWNKVLAPMVAAGAKLESPAQVMGAVAAGLRDKKISYNEATQLTTLYGAGIEINNATRNWVATGLPQSTGYIVNTDYGQVNMTDQAQVSRMINKMMVQNRIGFSGGNFGIVN